MSGLFETVAWNSLAATMLALLVLLAGRVWKRPELLHVLWLVVLVKLVTPGVIQLDTLPVPAVSPPPVTTLSVSPAHTAPTAVSATTDGLRLGDATFALWIGGTLVLLAFVGFQCARFARVMRHSIPVDRALRERIERLARRLGVDTPVTRVIDASIPPLVWGGLGRGRLVLPAGLLARLEVDETDTLLAHELAHLKRRDPWIRWVELAVTAALWWNPVVWWVRRNLRRAEELACDRWVLDLLPGSKRAYADGIVKTVEFLAGRGRPPVLATGAIGTRHIKERLTMILNPSLKGRLRRPLVPALLLAMLALPIVPGFADRDDADAERARAEMLELEREARELEHRLQVIRTEQIEIEKRLGESRFHRESSKARHEAEELRRAGKHAEAAQLEDEIERMEREVDERRAFEAEQWTFEIEKQRAELGMREAMFEAERARRAEDRALAQKHEQAAAEYKRALAGRAGSHEDALRAYEKALQSRQREKVELQRTAEELRTVMETLGSELDQVDDAERERVERAIKALQKQLQKIEIQLRESGAR